MSLSNELTSEIAEALLSKPNRSARESKDLQEVIFRIHNALRQMDDQATAGRTNNKIAPEKGAAAGKS